MKEMNPAQENALLNLTLNADLSNLIARQADNGATHAELCGMIWAALLAQRLISAEEAGKAAHFAACRAHVWANLNTDWAAGERLATAWLG